MDIIKLSYVFYKFAAPPPKTRISIEHVYVSEIDKDEIVPEKWKEKFKAILNIKLRVMTAIPSDKYSFKDFQKLREARKPLTSVIRALIDDTKDLVSLNYDWNRYYEAVDKLEKYEFILNPYLYFEVSDWVFECHSVISVMYRIIKEYYAGEDWRIVSPKPIMETEKDREYISLEDLEDFGTAENNLNPP